MSDLVAFLRARLDEDEARRWAVHDVSKCDALLYEDLPATEPLPDAGDCECGYPARVLREVEAKRAILADHYPVDPCDAYDADLVTTPCDTILDLATVYSDHPGYRDEWKP